MGNSGRSISVGRIGEVDKQVWKMDLMIQKGRKSMYQMKECLRHESFCRWECGGRT